MKKSIVNFCLRDCDLATYCTFLFVGEGWGPAGGHGNLSARGELGGAVACPQPLASLFRIMVGVSLFLESYKQRPPIAIHTGTTGKVPGD